MTGPRNPCVYILTHHSTNLSPVIGRNQQPTHTPHDSDRSLRFGIEVELSLRPKTPPVQKGQGHGGRAQVVRGVHSETYIWANIAELLTHHLQRKKLQVSWSESPVNLDYTKWNIVPEGTIKNAPGYCKQNHSVNIFSPHQYLCQLTWRLSLLRSIAIATGNPSWPRFGMCFLATSTSISPRHAALTSTSPSRQNGLFCLSKRSANASSIMIL